MELTHYKTIDKAIDDALYRNFLAFCKSEDEIFGVVHGPDDDYVVISEKEAEEFEFQLLDVLTKDFKQLSYDQIKAIRSDYEPLTHLEEIFGAFSTIPVENLLYILKEKIQLKQLIRYELSIRGVNKKGEWVGFEASKQIWFPNKN